MRGCGGDIYPYKAFNPGDFLSISSARTLLDRIWQYALPYFGGLLAACLNLRMLIKKKKSYGAEKNIFMLFAFAVLSYLCWVMAGGFIGFFSAGRINFYDRAAACIVIAVMAGFLAGFILTVLSGREDEKKTGVYQVIFALIYTLWMSPYIIGGAAYYGMKTAFWCMILLVVCGYVMYLSVPEPRCRIKY